MSGYSPFQGWSSGSPYALALGIAALLCILIARAAWQRRGQSGAGYLALMMGAAAWWALTYCWQLTTPGLQGKIFWLKLEYLGAAAVPLAWFLFARGYTGRLKKLDRRVLVALCAFPVITMLLVVTNEMHVLMWSSATVDRSGVFPALILTPGAWYWINTGYSYLLLAATAGLLLQMAFRFPRSYRRQAYLLLSAVFIPWAGNGLSTLVFRHVVDVTPFAFMSTGLLLLAAMSRGRLFELLPGLVPLARLRVLETMPDAVLVADKEGVVVTANPAARALFAGDAQEVEGLPMAGLWGGALAGHALPSGEGERFEVGAGEGDERRYYDVVSSPVASRVGGMGSLLVLRDVTARVRAEGALRGSEERLRAIFEQRSVGIALFGLGQRFIRVSPAFCSMLGYAEAELLAGMTIADVTAPDDRDGTEEAAGPLFSGESALLQLDKRYVRKDGSTFWGHVSATLLRSPDGQPLGAVAIVQDITERKHAEQALETSRAQLEAAMDLAGLVSWELDGLTDTFTFNDRFYALYGTTAKREGGYFMSAQKYSRRFLPESERSMVAEEVRKASATDDADYRANVEHTMVRRDGEVRDIVVRYSVIKDAQGRTIGTRGANQDITERKRTEQALVLAEEQLRQSQKMEAVGQLAGGIAHDFNNLLTAIIGNSDLALDGMPFSDPFRPFVEDIRTAGERAAGLTRQILAFSRRQMLKPEVLCLNDVVSTMEPLLHRTLGERVQIDVRLGPDLRLVEVDPHQMEQVLMNLAVNGRDAMPAGGCLTIETSNVELDAGFCALHPELAPGAHVVLAVSDTGSGMDADTLERIFEPFFTTKEQGKGTGLGLSTVFGIVRQSGGIVLVDSEIDRGSTFRVTLPVSTSTAGGESERSRRKKKVKGSETILVVEDERPVRELVVRILTRAGYQTLEAGSAAEANSLMMDRDPELDLLLTDMVLPGGWGGREVAEAARGRRPGLPVIFMSGYTQDSSVLAAPEGGESTFLEKPFTADDLLAYVRGALDSHGVKGSAERFHQARE